MAVSVYEHLLFVNPESARSAETDTILLNTGSPNFPVDEAVKEAINGTIASIQYLTYPPTEGRGSLRKEIAKFHRQHLNLPHEEKNILITHGAMHALFVTCSTLVGLGETVLLPHAYWFHFPKIIGQTGAEIKFLPTTDETGFKLTPDLLEEGIRRSNKPKLLLLTNPNNPAGTVFTQKELEGLVGVLENHEDILIISDEVYNLLLPDRADEPGVPACQSIGSFEAIKDRVFTINSLAKNYTMSGLRVGYVAAHERFIGDLTSRLRFSTLGVNEYLQAGAQTAIAETERILAALRRELKERRDQGAPLLRDIPGIEFIWPEAGYYFAVNVKAFIGRRTPEGKLIKDDEVLTEYLDKQGRVRVVAGTTCATPNYLRITFAVDKEDFKEGIRRMKKALADLKP